MGQTGRSSRWSHVHPGNMGEPCTGRRARDIAVQQDKTYKGVRPCTGGHGQAGYLSALLSVCYVGEPDAAMSCPSGSEGAGRKRTPERVPTRRPSTLCHPAFAKWLRYSHYTGITRSQRCQNYHDLYSRPPAWRIGSKESTGSCRTVIQLFGGDKIVG